MRRIGLHDLHRPNQRLPKEHDAKDRRQWQQRAMVALLEVGHLFETTVISAVEGIEKPDPAIYELALERSGAFKGRYHVLGGTLSALDGVGPDDLRIPELVARAKREGAQISST